LTLVSIIKIYDCYPGGKSATNATITTKAAGGKKVVSVSDKVL
jgi:hypothetical protein